ncbi:hypothetical protein LTR10_011268 [Elasticomyces elasticus]|nr:hypothetical protein LTR10_011268 [Elasticomyces elasticus]KAK4966316.1 hypothetical protein LTR42_011477 [Elasticomyces elasticus]
MAESASGSSKRRTASVDGGPVSKRFRPSFSNTITVLAGEEEEPFTVHVDTICQRSDFFTAACRKEKALWMSRQSNIIALYIAADFLGDESLKERAIDGVLNVRDQRHKLYMEEGLISKVWESTTLGSGLRRVIMDYIISSPGGDKYILDLRLDDKAPTEFFVDIAVRSLFLHGPATLLRPRLSRKEYYYDRELPKELPTSDEESSSDEED